MIALRWKPRDGILVSSRNHILQYIWLKTNAQRPEKWTTNELGQPSQAVQRAHGKYVYHVTGDVIGPGIDYYQVAMMSVAKISPIPPLHLPTQNIRLRSRKNENKLDVHRVHLGRGLVGGLTKSYMRVKS